MPNTIGTQIAWLRRLNPSSMGSGDEDHREQHQHADDHGERVVIDESRLQVSEYRREPSNRARRAVDEYTVDHRHVPALPQPGADHARAACEEPVVEAIEAVF